MPRASIAAHGRLLSAPLVETNPITLQVLGLCSALAVTASLLPAAVMGLAVIAVLAFANFFVSLLRPVMPQSIRLIIEMTLIASAVIVVDETLKAFLPQVADVLSVFVGLIITNCIVLARVETFAMHNGPLPSLMDGIGNGLGYAWILVLIGAVRELLGSGSVGGMQILPLARDGGWFEANQFMLLTPSAFFILALLVWLIRSRYPVRDPATRKAGGRTPGPGPSA